MTRITPIILLLLLFHLTGCNSSPSLESDTAKQSYAFGYFIGQDLQQKEAAIDPEALYQGIQDGLGTNPQLTEEAINAAWESFQLTVRKNHTEKQARLKIENSEKSTAFLSDNKTKEGIITTASGLQYRINKKGTGKQPALSDSVVVHYRGTLLDGTEFDSSYKRNKPATFGVTQVIKGWTEALTLMTVGSQWTVYLPASLAYGEYGSGPLIGPNQALIFEIELLDIAKK